MDVFDNYKKYRQYKPEYTEWKKNQDLQEAKRQQYLKNNPAESNNEDIKRGKALLHAIDVMDEYSQTNAEDMEVATEMAAGQVTGLVDMAGILLGFALINVPAVKNRMAKYAGKNKTLQIIFDLVPTAIGLAAATIAMVPVTAWAARVQVGASRKGRFEAMNKDLKNPVHFAVLTEEQTKEAKEKAKNIPVDEDMKRMLKASKGFNMGFMDTIRTLKKLAKNDTEYEKQKEAFEKEIFANEMNFEKPLSHEAIRKAKRDKQILSKLVQKIDIASQDYAENVELATNTASVAALGSGVLVGWLSNKVLKLFKANPNSKLVKFAPWAIGLALTLTVSTMAAKVQKQASRVARFNIRKEMSENPQSLVYVDDEKADTVKDVKVNKETKPNFFEFLWQAYKDNKVYTKYLKKEGLEEKKFHKALENMQLSEQQLKEAKTLQRNTFKTFNKVDENSQTYSESVEAVGQIIQQPLITIGSMLGMGLGLYLTRNDFKKIAEDLPKKELTKLSIKTGIKNGVAIIAGILPGILFDIYITKEQKKASRIADMLAIKELQDYRHFADFENAQPAAAQKIVTAAAQKSSLLSDFIKNIKR